MPVDLTKYLQFGSMIQNDLAQAKADQQTKADAYNAALADYNAAVDDVKNLTAVANMLAAVKAAMPTPPLPSPAPVIMDSVATDASTSTVVGQ